MATHLAKFLQLRECLPQGDVTLSEPGQYKLKRLFLKSLTASYGLKVRAYEDHSAQIGVNIPAACVGLPFTGPGGLIQLIEDGKFPAPPTGVPMVMPPPPVFMAALSPPVAATPPEMWHHEHKETEAQTAFLAQSPGTSDARTTTPRLPAFPSGSAVHFPSEQILDETLRRSRRPQRRTRRQRRRRRREHAGEVRSVHRFSRHRFSFILFRHSPSR